MSREKFIQDIREAWGHFHSAPRIETDGGQPASSVLTRWVAGPELWLSTRWVTSFDPGDFSDLPEGERRDLRAAVDDFRALAATVSPKVVASDDQVQQGRERFERLADRVKEIVLGDWVTSVEGLVSDAESWSIGRGWACRRELKDLREKLLGSYTLPQLLIQPGGSRFLLDPVARFIPGGLGLADLAVIPSFDSIMISRTRDGWQIHLGDGRDFKSVQTRPWSEPAFMEAIGWLGRHA